MQELVLVQPGRTVDRLAVAEDEEDELAREAAQADTKREFEERLSECGPLAYRVARGVLRNDADAEDVAQEALLRAYRQFDRLRDPNRFRSWLAHAPPNAAGSAKRCGRSSCRKPALRISRHPANSSRASKGRWRISRRNC